MLKKVKRLIILTTTTSIILLGSITAFAQSVITYDEFKSEIVTHMNNRETSFSINYTGDSTAFIKDVNTLIKDAPKADEYLNLSWVKQSGNISGTSGNLIVSLTVSYLTTKEQEELVDQKVAEIVSSVVTQNMTIEQKLKALHDYVCSITVYDYSLQKNSAYTALFDGETICRGYTLLLDKLYDKIGVPNHIVIGTLHGESHAWNMVQVDGKWSHIDATNDDANNSSKYYMVSDASLTSYGFVWNNADYPLSGEATTQTPAQQKVSEATKATITAETSLTLADKAIADRLVSALPIGNDKASLTARLIILKVAMNLNSATISVVKAEITPTQDNVNLANKAIAILPSGSDKTALQSRITAIVTTINQQKLQTATISVAKAETSVLLIDISSAQTLVNALPNSDGKTSLIARLNVVKQYVFATNLVVTAEKIKTQASLSTAIKSVNLLTDGSIKTALKERLQIVQAIVDNENIVNATNAVTKAETSLLNTDVLNAQKLVTILVDGDNKTTLQNKLTAVSQKILQNVISAVVKVEESLKSEDKVIADKLVNGLPAVSDKISLTTRLKTVNQYVVTINLVISAEKSKTQVSVNTATKAVDLLTDESVKTALKQRLQSIQTIVDNVNLVNATNAVTKAEKSLLTTDLINALKLVTILVDGNDETSLQDKLKSLSQKILENAIGAVVKVEESLKSEDKIIVDKLVNNLPVGIDKTSLTLRLKTVNQYVVNINLVVSAEKSKTQVSVNTATKAVNLLVEGSVKTSLLLRLQEVQTIVNNNNLVNATNSVNKAETSLLTTAVITAQKLVTILVDGTDKTTLQNRLTAISQKILQNAITAVTKAETSLTLVDKVSAEKLVNVLPTGSDKSSLTIRLKAVNQYLVTLNLVITAEKTISQASVNTANKTINLLTNETLKLSLKKRLRAVQIVISYSTYSSFH